MTVEEITRAVLVAQEAKDWDTMASYLSDDMVFSGPIPEPMNREQFLGLIQLMAAAFPDWSYNLSDVQVTGNVAHTTHQVTGTHTGDLDLSPMGMPTIPATGKAFKLPVEYADITVEDGKIVRFHAAVSDDGGLMGILQQLGVEMPSPTG